jgi:hypothetical protein
MVSMPGAIASARIKSAGQALSILRRALYERDYSHKVEARRALAIMKGTAVA